MAVWLLPSPAMSACVRNHRRMLSSIRMVIGVLPGGASKTAPRRPLLKSYSFFIAASICTRVHTVKGFTGGRQRIDFSRSPRGGEGRVRGAYEYTNSAMKNGSYTER